MRGVEYDAVVVGAGPAGTTAAYFMAKSGLEVALLERGEYPGSKNLGGGAIYVRPTSELLPGFWEEAPLERPLTRLAYWFMTADSAVGIDHQNARYARPPYNRFSILRARFDRWYAGKARRAGARLLVGHKASGLIVERGRVRGVCVEAPRPMELRANVVVLAEGSNPLLSIRAGLIPPQRRSTLSLYAKEIIELSPREIETRFGVGEGGGAVIGLLGYPTVGLAGTGSIYTNKDTVGLNVGMSISELLRLGINPNELLERVKRHPFVRPLLAGGKIREYTARMIPDGGFSALPRMVHPGALIVGDAAGLVNGSHGLDLAMFSGKCAAQAVMECRREGDFSAAALARYSALLRGSFVIKNLRANRGVAGFYRRHPHAVGIYARMLNRVADEMAVVRAIPLAQKRLKVLEAITDVRPPLGILGDLVDAWRSIL